MQKFILKKKDSGFTLIELLVVVAIIGLLISVVLASLSTARAKARDARRKEDLVQLRTALQLYWVDNGGTYPSTNGLPGNVANWIGNCASFGSYGTSGPGGWIPSLAPTYIPILPLDPNPIPPNNCYIYRSDTGSDYKISTFGTVETTISSTDPLKDPARSASYAVYTPGAAGY